MRVPSWGSKLILYKTHDNIIILNFGGNIFYVYLSIIPEGFELTIFDCISFHKKWITLSIYKVFFILKKSHV